MGAVNVATSAYRGALIGAVFKGSSSAQARALELKAARSILGPFTGSLGRAEAAAVCIGYWATRARALGPVLEERVMRQAFTQGVVDVG